MSLSVSADERSSATERIAPGAARAAGRVAPQAPRPRAVWRRLVRAMRWALGLGVLSLLGGALYLRSFELDPRILDPARGGPVVLLDRNGQEIRALPSEDGRPGRAAWVAMEDIPPLAVAGLVVSEDQDFYAHHGVSAEGIARALWLNLSTSGRYGGSTLTMQLARMIFSPGAERTYGRKVMEIRAALAIEREFGKSEILEQYLNRAYYGRGAHGLEAAARRYFGKPARTLSASEALFLTVLPRGPSYYDPLRHRDRVLARRRHIVELLVDNGRLDTERAERLLADEPALALHPWPDEAPHFTQLVLDELPTEVRVAGGEIETALDLDLQRVLQSLVDRHVEEQRRFGLSSAGTVVLDTKTAEILSLVCSARGSPGEAIDMTRWRRYPGSALKPFVYATAMDELGHHPGTIAFDVRDASPDYRAPQTPERGPVSYCFALANSLNFAAVHTLERVGLSRVMSRPRQAGVSALELPPEEYGPRLALGSTRVSLLDLSAGYRFMVRDGEVIRPRGVVRALSARGEGGERAELWRPARDARQVFSPATAAMVLDVLSDPEARRPVFGEDLPVDLPFRVAVKTGTAEGFSDTLAIAATDEVIVGAWVGRVDGAASLGRAGMQSAGPLVRQALLAVARRQPGGARLHLPRIVSLPRLELCPLSGMRRGPRCPHGVHEPVPDPARVETCSWHAAGGEQLPPQLARWRERHR